MEKTKAKILAAEEAQGYVYITFKIKGEKYQVASDDKGLIDMVGKEVLVSKPENKDYIFEPMK